MVRDVRPAPPRQSHHDRIAGVLAPACAGRRASCHPPPPSENHRSHDQDKQQHHAGPPDPAPKEGVQECSARKPMFAVSTSAGPNDFANCRRKARPESPRRQPARVTCAGAVSCSTAVFEAAWVVRLSRRRGLVRISRHARRVAWGGVDRRRANLRRCDLCRNRAHDSRVPLPGLHSGPVPGAPGASPSQFATDGLRARCSEHSDAGAAVQQEGAGSIGYAKRFGTEWGSAVITRNVPRNSVRRCACAATGNDNGIAR
jgi:hypothetical protein